MGFFGDVGAADVIAHIFFIGAGTALGVRVADDLMYLRDRRAERIAARKQA